LAAEVAVATVRAFVVQEPALQEVLFVCFTAWDLAAYEAVLGRPGSG
jgi:O-acetyl-ADP-ribose deacetylase (regulator of RNase III)